MPKVDQHAVLEVPEVRRGHAAAHALGLLEGTLFDWMYEFGARASEPGMQVLADVDMRANRARPIHLKRGMDKSWHALLPYCRVSLPKWLAVRPDFVTAPEHKNLLFPDTPSECDACEGTGVRAPLRLDKATGRRYRDVATAKPCHHCRGTGRRFGISRFRVHQIITQVLADAGVEPGRRHPHVLRHSIITHLLEGETPPGAIKDRVGHSNIGTTLGYVNATKAAAAKLEGALSGLYGEEEV